jgi:hypothetical protein
VTAAGLVAMRGGLSGSGPWASVAGLTPRRLRGKTSFVTPVEVLRGGRSVLTRHGPDAYPGLQVVKPGSEWPWIIVLEEGQTIEARGGETTYSYETVDGGKAQGFLLALGDRATLTRTGLPFSFVEWRIERR